MDKRKNIIAIDGLSSCGKSTLARDLARHYGYVYVDTGAMYRAVTLYFLENAIALDDPQSINEALGNIHIHFETHNGQQCTYLNGNLVEDDIRTPRVAALVSPVAAISAVRSKLVEQQRKMGMEKGIVMDGRDIGTVVFPNAHTKLFITANMDVRAKRRHLELLQKGLDISLAEVTENLAERDRIDSTREDSPLKIAEDAIVFDNSNLNIEDQFNNVLKIIEEHRSER